MAKLEHVLFASAARTATANGSAVDCAKLRDYGANSIACMLDITAVSGTSPTLDVEIQTRGADGVWHKVKSFAQKTAAGQERITLDGPVGGEVRARAVIAGTSPSFTFSVALVGHQDH